MLAITPRSLLILRQSSFEAENLVRVALNLPRQRPRKLNRDRQARVVNATVLLLKTWRNSRFEHEGACRAGLRSALCLEGWRWVEADNCAAEIVGQALNRIGAMRPTWAEGQPEVVDTNLITRTRCVHCGGNIPEERADPRVKYCSDRCRSSSYARKAAASHETMTRVEYLAKSTLKTERTIRERSGHCEQCGTFFVAVLRDRRFCSPACSGLARRLIPESECQNCGKTFKPKAAHKNKFCSQACFVEKRDANRVAVDCETCGTPFFKLFASQDRKFCSRACYGLSIRRPTFTCEPVEAAS